MFFATSGTSLHIGAVRQDWTARQVSASDFTGEAWTQVNGLYSLGQISGEWQTNATMLPDPCDPDNPPIPDHQKIARPAQTMEVVTAQNDADAGQLLMLSAENSVNPHAFMLTFANGSSRQFIAHVMSAGEIMDEANSVVCWSFGLLLQSNIARSA
ncbi:hypothetical protein DKP76_10520 [Falsochrobactrum shanghaiense]|uniref:Phage tail protein n=1 Tax=Falsochrobactrum shanghaiense TaxID=2201899 RepID=A0A316J9J3_9HYPH|nr:hypothetical protein [Falsochrobactrum shanghaiense]PWL18144.1 hypothetical protein DKP76_10520 [Falsochrobactrum shanghaiense]